MKLLVTFIILISVLSGVNAQDNATIVSNKSDSVRVKHHTRIIAYKFNHDFSSIDSIPIDTILRRFQVFYKPISERALNVFLGNMNLPYTSVIFANQKPYNDFLFSQNIEYNFHQPEDIIYYKTWTPFTKLTYYTGGAKTRQEQTLNIIHTQNVNKNLNVGFLGDLNYADGQYLRQKARSNAFTLWAGYKGLRYSAYGNVSLNSYKAQENGGIAVDSVYTKGTFNAIDVPVNLQAADVVIKRQTIFLYHRLYLTGSFKSDSLSKGSKWNEALSIIHQFKYEHYGRGFMDDLSIDRKYYKANNFDTISNYYSKLKDDAAWNKILRKDSAAYNLTKDSTYFRRIENTFQLAFNANDLLKVPAELRFGIKSQIDRYKYGSKLDSTNVTSDTTLKANPMKDSGNDINTAFVGSLTNRFSKTLRWGASGEYYITGSKAGNVELIGDIEKSIKRNFILKLYGRFANTKPGYFIRNFESSNISWSNKLADLPSQKTYSARMSIYQLKYKFFLDVGLDYFHNYYYFGTDAKPIYALDLSVQSLTVNKLIDWGFFHSDFRLTFQSTTDKSAVAIPNFSGFNSSYVEFTLFKVLHVQYGADLFYNSAFYSNAYSPETGMFYSQSQIKTGNYPYADMFLNMKLKRFRFFLKYERVNTWFSNSPGFNLPHYPFNPSILKYGLSWTFYD